MENKKEEKFRTWVRVATLFAKKKGFPYQILSQINEENLLSHFEAGLTPQAYINARIKYAIHIYTLAIKEKFIDDLNFPDHKNMMNVILDYGASQEITEEEVYFAKNLIDNMI